MRLQFMSLSALILVALMVTELFVFAIVAVGYSNLFQSSALSSTSSDYGTLVYNSANSFAGSALSSALGALFVYEYNASYRKGYMITNLTNSVDSLIETGTLPGVASGSPAGMMLLSYMKNSTFGSYNAYLISSTGFSARNIIVNETVPVVTQYSPYSLSINYVENVAINTSSGSYNYHIPVNASVNLNGTYDLLYAEQGILRQIRFANLSNATYLVGNQYAIQSNSGGVPVSLAPSAYGTVVNVPGLATCVNVTSIVLGPLSGVIIATSDASTMGSVGINNCENRFRGIITQHANITNPPSIPYLVYPATGANILASLPNNSKVLLYGPGLETLNIEALRNEISGGYYFTSPFTPSYMQRLQGNITAHSRQGIFTVSDYARRAAAFDGMLDFSGSAEQYLTVPNNNIFGTMQKQMAVTAWIFVPAGKTEIAGSGIVCKGYQGGEAWCLNFGPSVANQPQFYINIGGTDYLARPATPLTAGKWHFLSGTYDGNNVTLYVDGGIAARTTTGGLPLSTNTHDISIAAMQSSSSSSYNLPVNANLSNVQIYNTSLSGRQVWGLYQQGIGAVPVSNNGLVGWWLTDGDSADHSGFYNNAVDVGNPNLYAPVANYMRDAVFGLPLESSLWAQLNPVPGILNCDTVKLCASALQHIYLGANPLETGSAKAAYFNGNAGILSGLRAGTWSGFIHINGVTIPAGGPFTVAAWANFANTKNRTVVAKENTGLAQPFDAYVPAGTTTMNFAVGNGASTQIITCNSCVALNRWQHWIFVYTGSTMSIYLNGTLVAGPTTVSVSVSDTGTPLRIGARDSQAKNGAYFQQVWDRPMNGSIADVQLYSSVLTQSQISALYSNGITASPVSTGSLLGWWPLNGDANDHSGYNGYGNNGNMSDINFVSISVANVVSGLSAINSTSDEWKSFGMTTP